MPRSATAILCIGLDPFLLRLVRTACPDADVRRAHDDASVLQQLARRPTVIVQSASGPGARIAAVAHDARTVTIVDASAGSEAHGGNGHVLVRPIEARQLRLAIARASGGTGRLRDRLAPLDLTWTAPSLFAAVRAVLVLLVVVRILLGASGAGGPSSVVLVAIGVLLLHAGWRVRRSELDARLLASDVVVATAAGVAVGLQPSPMLLLIVIAAVQFGFAAAPSNLLGIVACLTSVTLLSEVLAAPPSHAGASFLVVVLVGLLGHGLAETSLERRGSHRRIIRDVHGALVDLHRHAQGSPSRLHASSLGRDLVTSARDQLRADRVALASGPQGTWSQPATAGFVGDGASRAHLVAAWIAGTRSPTVVTGDPLASLVGGGQWVICAPVELAGQVFGALFAAWDAVPASSVRRTAQHELRELAQDAAMALDSAELFAAVDQLAVNGERLRIARDLHDGIVQSFVHVGLELDRLSTRLADVDVPAALEVVRLRDVVAATVQDSRRVIVRLQSRHLDHGLRAALESHLVEVSGVGSPRASLAWDLADDLCTEAASELFRVVQEALANARQHARASEVRVSVRRHGEAVEVTVEDDGVGLPPDALHEGALRGHGLPAMRDRLSLLGGELRIGPAAGGGTTVTALVCGVFVAPERRMVESTP